MSPREYDDEFEERPRRRRPPPRDEDEFDEDDRPRRRRRPEYEDEDEDDDYDRPRRRRRRREREVAEPSIPVTIVGVLNVGIVLLFVGLVVYNFFAGWDDLRRFGIAVQNVRQQAPNNPQVQQAVGLFTLGIGFLIAALFCFFTVFLIPLLIAGIGVLMRRQWGRILTLIYGCLCILAAISGMQKLEDMADVWRPLIVAVYGVFVVTILVIPQFAAEFE